MVTPNGKFGLEPRALKFEEEFILLIISDNHMKLIISV
jgi:hypothetical protein